MIYDIWYYIYICVYIHHIIWYHILSCHIIQNLIISYPFISYHIMSFCITHTHIYIYISHVRYIMYTIQYTISISYRTAYQQRTSIFTQAWERVTTGGRAARGEKGTLALCPKPSHFFGRLMAVISGKPWSTPNEAMCIKDTYLHNNNQRKFS